MSVSCARLPATSRTMPRPDSSSDMAARAPSPSVRSWTQSKSLLRAVLMNDRIPAAITGAVLFFVGIHRASPSGTSSSSRNGSFLMKNRSTARICCTCVTRGVGTAEAGVDARLCVLPRSDGMHDQKIASALRTSCFVTSQCDIPASSISIVACDDAYPRRAISSRAVLACVTSRLVYCRMLAATVVTNV